MTNPNEETEDLLIHRAVSLTAMPRDWDTLDALSERDPELWQRMAHALRDEGSLTLAIDARTEVARDVEPFKTGKRARLGFTSASGWFAAAAIAACWFTTLMQTGPAILPGSSAPNESIELRDTPGLVSNETHGVLGTPTPVGTLPDVLLSSQRAQNGDGYEITVLKRSLEKVKVKDLFQLQRGEDELGNPATMPVRFTAPNLKEKY